VEPRTWFIVHLIFFFLPAQVTTIQYCFSLLSEHHPHPSNITEPAQQTNGRKPSPRALVNACKTQSYCRTLKTDSKIHRKPGSLPPPFHPPTTRSDTRYRNERVGEALLAVLALAVHELRRHIGYARVHKARVCWSLAVDLGLELVVEDDVPQEELQLVRSKETARACRG
jgi:hypothetical protein